MTPGAVPNTLKPNDGMREFLCTKQGRDVYDPGVPVVTGAAVVDVLVVEGTTP